MHRAYIPVPRRMSTDVCWNLMEKFGGEIITKVKTPESTLMRILRKRYGKPGSVRNPFGA